MADRHELSHSHGAANERRTLWCALLTGGFMCIEVAGGVIAGSLALIADAGHMLTDVIGLGMALAAIQLATRCSLREQPDESHTFGVYRLEILAAFVNALLLFGVAIWVVVEATRRLFDEPEVIGVPMLILLGST